MSVIGTQRTSNADTFVYCALNRLVFCFSKEDNTLKFLLISYGPQGANHRERLPLLEA